MKNKKGDGGTSFLIYFLLGILLLVLVALFYYFFYVRASDVGKTLPSVLVAKLNQCKNFGNQKTAYCEYNLEPIKLGGKDYYINCEFDGNREFRKEIDEAITEPITCDTTPQDFCLELMKDKNFKFAIVNNLECKPLKCGEMGSLWQAVSGWYDTSECQNFPLKDVTASAADRNENIGKRCCVYRD